MKEIISTNFRQLFCCCLWIVIIASGLNGQDQSHECERPCERDAPPKICKYNFEVEKYWVGSKACYKCPFMVKDCFRLDCIAADGVERLVSVINRKLPAESVQICLGDSVEIVVHNMMSEESLSIHWHGVHQEDGTQFMDGVALITQCPIPPNTSFKYSFKPTPQGTHLFHAHLGLQKSDGLFGGFIVRKPIEDEFYKHLYTDDLHEHLLIINDWIHEPILDRYVSHYQALGTNKPDTILINGKGRYKTFHDEAGKTVYTPVAKFTVAQGKKYRMRVINAGTLYCPIQMMIDNHKMKIIATDGFDIDMIEADSLVTYNGERWDFILEANQNADNYWIKFKGLQDCNEKFNSAFNVAVLHYDRADDSLPNSEVTYEKIVSRGIKVNPVNVPTEERTSLTISELKSVLKDPTSDPALGKLELEPLIFSFDFYPIDNPIFHKHNLYGFNQVPEEYQRLTPQVNHISMKMPSFPPLSQPEDIKPDTFCDERQNKDCTKEFCWCTYLKPLPMNTVVEMILIDEGQPFNSNHPFHLHGYSFRVIAMEKIGENTNVETVKKMIAENKVRFNLTDPVYKDTVTVPRGGFTVLRVFTKNPGYWLLHCHLDFHMEAGMSILFRVGEDKVDIPPPPKNFPQCGDFV